MSHTPKRAAEPSPENDRIGGEEPKAKELIAFGSAQLVGDLQSQTTNIMLMQILNMVLHVNPALVGGVLSIRSMIDAVTDPIMGHISDGARTRWGRRRPFVLAGGLAIGVLVVVMWQFDREWSEQAIVTYVGVCVALLALASTVFGVPYGALGFELSPSYSGRTRVQVYRAYWQKTLGMFLPWMMTFVMLPFFGDGLTGMRVFSIIFAVLIAAASFACFKLCKERTLLSKKDKIGKGGFVADFLLPVGKFFASIGTTIVNIHFAKITLIYMSLIFLLGVFQLYGNYLTVYYLFGGDVLKGSAFHGGAATLGAVFGFLAIPFASMLAKRFEKHIALRVCIGFMAFGSALNWWCINPDHPWLLYLVQPFYSVGIAALFVLLGSMFNDVIDIDDLNSGVRREGLFSAVSGFFMKMASAGASVCTGIVLNFTRFDSALGGAQPEGTFDLLRMAYAFGPVVILSVCILLLWRYPLTERRVLEVQHKLHKRNPSGNEASSDHAE